MSGQPDEHDVDRGEVNRREERNVTPVDPAKKNTFTPMNIAMAAVIVVIVIWFLYTQLA